MAEARPRPTPGEITALLTQAQEGSRAAVDRLMALVYDELKLVAQRQLRAEDVALTLAPTALVHEVYLKLLQQESLGFRTRCEFFAVASQAMRRILVDHARRRKAKKRAAGEAAEALDETLAQLEQGTGDLEALDQALLGLARIDPEKARLVELRFFGGLTMDEAAEALGLPLRTAERSWSLARAFLKSEMEKRA